MKKFVSLAGPIAGCNENEANDWRSFVQENLNRNIVGISPLRCEPISENHYTSGTDSRFNTPKAIAAKNWYDTEACDLVLAYLPKELNERRPSYGTTIEIGWAIGLRKPLIVVTDDEYLASHPLIQTNADWIFNNLNDALDVIHGLFGDYVGD